MLVNEEKKSCTFVAKVTFLCFLSRKEKVSVKQLLLASFFKEAKEKKKTHEPFCFVGKKTIQTIAQQFCKSVGRKQT